MYCFLFRCCRRHHRNEIRPKMNKKKVTNRDRKKKNYPPSDHRPHEQYKYIIVYSSHETESRNHKWSEKKNNKAKCMCMKAAFWTLVDFQSFYFCFPSIVSIKWFGCWWLLFLPGIFCFFFLPLPLSRYRKFIGQTTLHIMTCSHHLRSIVSWSRRWRWRWLNYTIDYLSIKHMVQRGT